MAKGGHNLPVIVETGVNRKTGEVFVVDSSLDQRKVVGGPPQRVVVLTDVDLAAGNYDLKHLSSPLPVQAISGRGRKGGDPVLVYDVSGLLSGGGGAGGVTTLFEDTFTDANGTSLDAHVPDTDESGNGWTENSGDFDIQSNRGNQTTAAAGLYVATFDISKADGTISTILRISASGRQAAVVARFADISNLYLIRISSIGNEFAIIKREGGINSTLDSTIVTIDNGQDYLVEVDLDGDTITATVGGANEISATSAFGNANAAHGVHTRDQGDRFDSVTFVG